jgi:hypothetical protein
MSSWRVIFSAGQPLRGPKRPQRPQQRQQDDHDIEPVAADVLDARLSDRDLPGELDYEGEPDDAEADFDGELYGARRLTEDFDRQQRQDRQSQHDHRPVEVMIHALPKVVIGDDDADQGNADVTHAGRGRRQSRFVRHNDGFGSLLVHGADPCPDDSP